MPRAFLPHADLHADFKYEQDSLSNIWMYMSIQPVGLNNSLVLYTDNSFRSLSLEMGTDNSHAVGELEFFIETAPNLNYKSADNSLIVNSYDLVDGLKTNAYPTVYFRWGWMKAGTGPGASGSGGFVPVAAGGSMPIMAFSLANIECDFGVRGVGFKGSIMPIYTAKMSTKQTVGKRAWKDVNADQIVIDILDAYGQPAGQRFIDGCPIKIDAITMQASETPVDFINNTLLKKIVDSKGQTYRFWIDVFNNAHFVRSSRAVRSTAGSSSSSGATLDEGLGDTTRYIRKQFLYNASQAGLVISFEPSDKRVAAMFSGGDDVTYTYTPGPSGEPVEKHADHQTGVSGRGVGEYTNGFEGKISAIKTGANQSSRTVNVHGSNQGNNEVKIAHHHATIRGGLYKASMETQGIPYLIPLDYIQVDSVDCYSYLLPQSGVYQILKLVHTVAPGKWTTNFELARQGDVLGDLSVVGQGLTATVSPHTVDTDSSSS